MSRAPGTVTVIGRIEGVDRHWIAERIETHNAKKPRWRVREMLPVQTKAFAECRAQCFCDSRQESLRELELRAAMRRSIEAMKAESRACGCRR